MLFTECFLELWGMSTQFMAGEWENDDQPCRESQNWDIFKLALLVENAIRTSHESGLINLTPGRLLQPVCSLQQLPSPTARPCRGMPSFRYPKFDFRWYQCFDQFQAGPPEDDGKSFTYTDCFRNPLFLLVVEGAQINSAAFWNWHSSLFGGFQIEKNIFANNISCLEGYEWFCWKWGYQSLCNCHSNEKMMINHGILSSLNPSTHVGSKRTWKHGWLSYLPFI